MTYFGKRKSSKFCTMDRSKILVFDLETTGFSPEQDEILQIAIFDGNGSELFSSYICPRHRKKWPFAQKVNHISPDMVKEAPTFPQVRDEIQKLFDKATLIVGYNVNFDLNFITKSGIVVSGSIFDVMTEFASYRAAVDHVAYRKCKLIECASYFRHSYSPHDAIKDASVTLQCFNSLVQDERFTSFDHKEKHEDEVTEKRDSIPITFKFQTRRRKNIAFRGFFLLVLSQVLSLLTLNELCLYPMHYWIVLTSAVGQRTHNYVLIIVLILIPMSILMIGIGIVQAFIRFPRWIASKLKHFINRFC